MSAEEFEPTLPERLRELAALDLIADTLPPDHPDLHLLMPCRWLRDQWYNARLRSETAGKCPDSALSWEADWGHFERTLSAGTNQRGHQPLGGDGDEDDDLAPDEERVAHSVWLTDAAESLSDGEILTLDIRQSEDIETYLAAKGSPWPISAVNALVRMTARVYVAEHAEHWAGDGPVGPRCGIGRASRRYTTRRDAHPTYNASCAHHKKKWRRPDLDDNVRIRGELPERGAARPDVPDLLRAALAVEQKRVADAAAALTDTKVADEPDRVCWLGTVAEQPVWQTDRLPRADWHGLRWLRYQCDDCGAKGVATIDTEGVIGEVRPPSNHRPETRPVRPQYQVWGAQPWAPEARALIDAVADSIERRITWRAYAAREPRTVAALPEWAQRQADAVRARASHSRGGGSAGAIGVGEAVRQALNTVREWRGLAPVSEKVFGIAVGLRKPPSAKRARVGSLPIKGHEVPGGCVNGNGRSSNDSATSGRSQCSESAA